MRPSIDRLDNRLVYSASGTWFGHTSEVGINNGLPVCPHCGSVLFEMDGDEKWWALAREFETKGHPGYVSMVAWGRGKCFPSIPVLREAWVAAGSPETEIPPLVPVKSAAPEAEAARGKEQARSLMEDANNLAEIRGIPLETLRAAAEVAGIRVRPNGMLLPITAHAMLGAVKNVGPTDEMIAALTIWAAACNSAYAVRGAMAALNESPSKLLEEIDDAARRLVGL